MADSDKPKAMAVCSDRLIAVDNRPQTETRRPRTRRRCCCCQCCSIRWCWSYVTDWFLGTVRGQVILLIIWAFVIVFVGALVWKAIGGSADFDTSWWHSSFISWGFFFDPGAHMGLPPDEPVKVRWVSVIFSVLGFLFNLVFLGVIVDWVRSYLDYIRKDRNRLFQGGHTLVLGWTDKTLFLLHEMVQEGWNIQNSRKIVIMAERDEVEMWQDIKRHFLKERAFYMRSLTVRRGCAYDLDDLIRANAENARDIIVLGCDASPREADLEVVRIMVALASLPHDLTAKVIAEVRVPEIGRVLKRIQPTAEGIHSRSSANCILCLLTVEPMIGDCFLSLCSFTGGEELYTHPVPDLAGFDTFGAACRKFGEALVIGVQHDGQLLLAPPDDLRLAKQDMLILISQDFGLVKQDVPTGKNGTRRVADSTPAPCEEVGVLPPSGQPSKVNSTPSRERFDAANPMTIIILGWPNDFVDIMMMLDRFVPPNTRVIVFATKPIDIRKGATKFMKPNNFNPEDFVGDRTCMENLRRLPLAEADAILVMAESTGSTMMAGDVGDAVSLPWDFGEDDIAGDDSITSDSACLTCMIMVTEVLESLHDKPREARIICEVLDPRTDVLLERNTGLSSLATFFRSNALETGMFTMASSEPVVFNALQLMMSPGVGDLAGVRAMNFFEGEQHSMSYWEMHDRVRARSGDLLVGWQRDTGRSMKTKRTVNGLLTVGSGILCPKHHADELLTFKDSDIIVVIRKPVLGPESTFLPPTNLQTISSR